MFLSNSYNISFINKIPSYKENGKIKNLLINIIKSYIFFTKRINMEK